MNKWDNYFMTIAEDTALLSKDPKTKVGACIVKDKKILSVGYNGAPRKFPDNLVPTGDAVELINQKNAYMVHAELNAILNYRGCLADFEGATVYVTISPCHDCAKALAQVGIKKIIYKEKYHRSNMTRVTDFILKECGIECISTEELCE